ncbi:hypothetical protein V6N12_033019 [Hibiscus sabdariffa]|uniref:Putative plant transposon protein domain-containing protein n=1 Tax=Hibiscus sabdariffa TaxID=183260 RepID=A0ABR2CET2_9ROSI
MANTNNTARYTMIAAKNRWEEQGFYFDDSLPNYGLEQFVYNRLNELGWFRLGRQPAEPARANYNWVIEFYANNSTGEDHSIVRGRRVPATAATINTIMGLPDNQPSFYAMLGGFEEEDFELIKDFLCKEGTAWNTTGRNPDSVSHLSLRPEVKLWNTFVKRNIMPTSHNQTVDRTRLLLIHTIMTGYRINVGEILAKELAAACANDKGILAFPYLISALCRRAAVSTSQGDKYQPEKTGWTRATYMRKMDVADATPLNMAMPTLPVSPIHTTTALIDEAGPSVTATQAEPQHSPSASPPIVPVPSHTTTSSPATTHSPPSPPAPAQFEEAAPPLHILQLRSQLQHLEARQIHFQEEMKSPRDHLQPLGPTHQTPAPTVPILSAAPTPTTSAIADRPTPESPTRRKGKAKAGRSFGRDIPSSPDDEEAEQRPVKRRRRYHVTTDESDDDDSSAELPAAKPEKSADHSLSNTF